DRVYVRREWRPDVYSSDVGRAWLAGVHRLQGPAFSERAIPRRWALLRSPWGHPRPGAGGVGARRITVQYAAHQDRGHQHGLRQRFGRSRHRTQHPAWPTPAARGARPVHAMRRLCLSTSGRSRSAWFSTPCANPNTSETCRVSAGVLAPPRDDEFWRIAGTTGNKQSALDELASLYLNKEVYVPIWRSMQDPGNGAHSQFEVIGF